MRFAGMIRTGAARGPASQADPGKNPVKADHMAIKDHIVRSVFQRYMAWRLKDLVAPRYPILLEYPIDPTPRWGYDKPCQPQLKEIVDHHRADYLQALQALDRHGDHLARIPVQPDPKDVSGPFWGNDFFSRLDAISLYGLLVDRTPSLYVEVGSGNSTRFCRRAITDHGLATRLVSIDPSPRSEVDAICDEVVRAPMEAVDLGVFDRVRPGDFVFIDNSHRAFTNSDATTFFIDVLPRLPSGVTVHIHDIFLPLDYPAVWSGRHYSEQYLLACYLLGARGGQMPRILLPNAYISYDPELCAVAQRLWRRPELSPMIDPQRPYGGIPGCHGTSFWFETP